MKFINVFSAVISIVIIYSCTTTKELQEENSTKNTLSAIKNNLVNFRSKIYIDANLENQTNSAIGKLKIASIDSISLSLYGPFGISIGKLYSDSSNLVFINPITNQILVGTPSNENMKSAIKINLSYKDFIRLLRNEPPENIDSFKFYKTLNDNEKLFICNNNKETIDFLVLKDNQITQFQRKSKQGEMILHVFYDEFKFIDKVNFPTKQIYKFPSLKATVNVTFKEFNTIDNFDEPFSFELPKNMEIINLDLK